MDKNKIILSISGMHCRSCEILIEDKLAQIAGIRRTVVNYKKGTAELHLDGSGRPSRHDIENAIREAGYNIGYNNSEKKPFFSKNPEDYKDLGIAFFFLVGIYIILKNFGITDINVGSASNPSSLPVVFLVGITAGLSTCMALVGGLILGISARHSELHPEATAMQKFRPHLFFNLGRIGGYALLGGILGALGSVLQLSGGTLGILTIGVGIVMLMLGMKLVGIFPRMENKSISLPSGISRMFGIKKHEKEYSHKGSMITGALTFFLPCGFTQAMQLYAISTGSFVQGALIMGIFALGTAPGLLGVGGLTSVIKGIFAQRFFKFAGVLVVILSFFNIANGYNLTGWQLGSSFAANSAQTVQASDPNVTIENGVQVVKMKETSSGYSPNKFTIKKGVPVKWVIDAQAPNSCASSIMISKLGIRKTLKAGQNIIEFTPTESGKLPFSCAMGMYTGTFNVVDENGVVPASTASTDTTATAPASGGSCGGSGGGGCGGCGGGAQVKKDTTDTVAKVDGGVQTISATYTANDYLQPNSFKVKAGTKVKLTIDVKDSGRGCGSTIMIPGLYSNATPLQAGTPIVMEFTPEKGSYDITCGMGMINYGTVTVE
ncbi:MAG: sulfite exporter TauE/SafE family protein [Candidatus Moranbacteria bacterium]|nr:sulfite exporter TauE/SafE family protein [Candidatus Moranbacteria bacterium]